MELLWLKMLRILKGGSLVICGPFLVQFHAAWICSGCKACLNCRRRCIHILASSCWWLCPRLPVKLAVCVLILAAWYHANALMDFFNSFKHFLPRFIHHLPLGLTVVIMMLLHLTLALGFDQSLVWALWSPFAKQLWVILIHQIDLIIHIADLEWVLGWEKWLMLLLRLCMIDLIC